MSNFFVCINYIFIFSIARGEITHDEGTGVCQFAAAKNPQKINPSGMWSLLILKFSSLHWVHFTFTCPLLFTFFDEPAVRCNIKCNKCGIPCQKRQYRTFYKNWVKSIFLLHGLLRKCAENLKRFDAKLVILWKFKGQNLLSIMNKKLNKKLNISKV